MIGVESKVETQIIIEARGSNFSCADIDEKHILFISLSEKGYSVWHAYHTENSPIRFLFMSLLTFFTHHYCY